MNNKTTLINLVVVLFFAIVILGPTMHKIITVQKEKSAKECTEYTVDTTFAPFFTENENYIAQFYRAISARKGFLKKVDVLLFNKTTNEITKYSVTLDGYGYDYLRTNAEQIIKNKIKDAVHTPNTINDVHITEYGNYRCIMILNPYQEDTNEVLIYLQDKHKGITIPLSTQINENNTWDSLKTHSVEFTKHNAELMFE